MAASTRFITTTPHSSLRELTLERVRSCTKYSRADTPRNSGSMEARERLEQLQRSPRVPGTANRTDTSSDVACVSARASLSREAWHAILWEPDFRLPSFLSARKNRPYALAWG